MEVMMKNLEISERFDLNDIRKIRAHNAIRYEHMTPAEIVADTKAGAAELLEIMNRKKILKIQEEAEKSSSPTLAAQLSNNNCFM